MLRKNFLLFKKKSKKACSSKSQGEKKHYYIRFLLLYSVQECVYQKTQKDPKTSSGRSLIFWFEKEYCSFKGIFF